MALNLHKLESLHPRMLYAKFGKNLPNYTGERDLSLSMNCYFMLRSFLRERREPYHFNKFNSLYLSMLCDKSEIDPVVQCFLTVEHLSSMGKGCEFTLPYYTVCQSCPVVLKKINI